ncbi:hypothetical protein [Inquilinus sp. OTU3971]|uniref:hypothetical protein n=1 Tax=Inquilinus sp. OTU3971 TaxID=3043855 RepID=UPI00313EF728
MPKPMRGEDAATLSRPFQPYRLPITATSRDLANAIGDLIEDAEDRGRGRKAADRVTFRATVAALVSDLAYRQRETGGEEVANADGLMVPAGLRLSMSRGTLGCKSSRYTPTWLGKTLRDVVKLMALPGVDLVTVELGAWGTDHGKGTLSIVRPGQALIERFEGLTFADLGLCPTQEIVMLRAPDASFWDRGKLVDYDDDKTTMALRSEVRTINEALALADVTFVADHPGTERVDTSLRRLRRCFNRSSFASGGRLFGGFWQSMTREERHSIRIDSGEVATLDYGQIGPRLLYALAKAEPPAGHLYALPLIGGEHRDGVKMLLAAATFATKRMKAWPEGCARLFPEGSTLRAMLTAIELGHRPITPLLYKGIGHQTMRTESDILVTVLLRLIDQGITALPIHDAVIVARPHVEAAERVMTGTFREFTGLEIPVTRE